MPSAGRVTGQRKRRCQLYRVSRNLGGAAQAQKEDKTKEEELAMGSHERGLPQDSWASVRSQPIGARNSKAFAAACDLYQRLAAAAPKARVPTMTFQGSIWAAAVWATCSTKQTRAVGLSSRSTQTLYRSVEPEEPSRLRDTVALQ